MRVTGRILILILAAALTAAAVSAEAETNYGQFLSELYAAGQDTAKLDQTAAETGDELACAIAELWKTVFLDPEFHLNIYETDDPALLPITGKHAFAVLGYELRNGEMTDELKARCEAAAAAARAFPDSILVCSGGATGGNNPEKHTEAGMMKEYLIQLGIAPERIFTDEQAMTTADNAVNTFRILKEQGIEQITTVTSDYHQRRAMMLYGTMAAWIRLTEGYPVTMAGNFCCGTDKAESTLDAEARTALWQLNGMVSRLLSGR